MNSYFTHDGQGQHGPFTLEQLKEQQLTDQTPIWYEGLNQWVTAGNLPELSHLLAKKSSPPPFIASTSSQVANSEEINSRNYAEEMEQYFPTEAKRSFKLPLIVIGSLLAAVVIFWLINKNNQHSDTIDDLQQQLSAQRSEAEQQRMEASAKDEASKRANDLLTQKNMNYRNNWEKYITFSNDKPAINYTWGGISAFGVSVTNTTDYVLDEVDVLVEYIRKNGTVWQTRVVSFLNVSPNSFEKKAAPDSENGVEVRLSIQKIVCKKMHFCYPIGIGNKNDPYYCI